MIKAHTAVQVGLLGLGTVGTGVMKALLQNGAALAERLGCRIEVPRILVRSLEKEREVSLAPGQLTTNPAVIMDNPEISVIIEVVGGIEPAKTLILQAIGSGKHVITANKELLAKHGAELFAAAEKAGVQLLYEASVAGGIPVIRFVQGYFAANRVETITGILNGTSNYILTKMQQEGLPFAEVLADAQAQGFAEADPTNDIEGFDAAYKLAILANLAFDVSVPVHEIPCRGISQIRKEDLQFARNFGYVVKLLAAARKTPAGIELSVGPQLLPFAHPLAQVNDVFNAVSITGDVVGELTFIGKGAGQLPTASAVLEDLAALLRQTGNVVRPARWNHPVNPAGIGDAEAHEPHYVRISSFSNSVAGTLNFARQFLQAKGSILNEKSVISEFGESLAAFIVTGITGQDMAELESLLADKNAGHISMWAADCKVTSDQQPQRSETRPAESMLIAK